jgi:hypothetical protein
LSWLHETLRRGTRSARQVATGPGSAHADTVLSTLGYRGDDAPRRTRDRFVVALLVTLALAAAYFAIK